MNTQELIKKAEDLLLQAKCGVFDCINKVSLSESLDDTAMFTLTANDVRLGLFAFNYLPEFISKLKSFDDVKANYNKLGERFCSDFMKIVGIKK